MVKRYLKTCKPFAPYATLENPMCIRANKSLDASGGSVFLNLLGAAKGALIRAAASTQPLCGTKAAVFRNAVSACGVTSLLIAAVLSH